MRRLSPISLIVLALLAAPALADAPPTAVEPVKETLHGVELVDPYRWLEGSDAPEIEEEMPELDRRVSKWTQSQNDYTRGVLDGLPGREPLEERLRELLMVGSVGPPDARGGRYFNFERQGDQAQPVLYVREGLDGERRTLLDPNALDAEGLTALAWAEPSHDGELVAFGLYRGGDENATLYLMRVDDGVWLADEIPGKVRAVYWLPDSTGFYYRALADAENPYSAQIKFPRDRPTPPAGSGALRAVQGRAAGDHLGPLSPRRPRGRAGWRSSTSPAPSRTISGSTT